MRDKLRSELLKLAKNLRAAFNEEYPTHLWSGEIKEQPKKNYKITLCIPIMNRLHELRETLHVNIDEAKSYTNSQFILLDYNSSDGLEGWVKSNLMEHIESGKIVYYRTEEPSIFHYSHSRNIAWKLATGELVTNIASKGFVQDGFLELFNLLANQQESKNIVFVRSIRHIRGRIGFYKSEFVKLGGFDEDLFGYAPWDRDIFRRSLALGYKVIWFGGKYGDFRKFGKGKGEGFLPYVDQRPKGWNNNEVLGTILSLTKALMGILVANQGKHWGKAKLIKNFNEEVEI